MNMRVEATVHDGKIDWRYVADGDEWKQSLPLHKLVPHPMISIDRGKRWKYLAMTLLIPLIAFVVLRWLEFELLSAVAASAMSLLVLGYRYSPWLLGPIEWATFDTQLKDKTVYVFRGSSDTGFDEFVAALNGAIENACLANDRMGEQ